MLYPLDKIEFMNDSVVQFFTITIALLVLRAKKSIQGSVAQCFIKTIPMLAPLGPAQFKVWELRMNVRQTNNDEKTSFCPSDLSTHPLFSKRRAVKGKKLSRLPPSCHDVAPKGF